MTTPLGMIDHESIDAYHATDAFSNSKLKDFDRLPQLYYERYVTKTRARRAQTAALSVGTALDLLLLEGVGPYHAKMAIKPETYSNDKGETKPWNGNANVCKAWMEGAEDAGRLVISPDEATCVEEMSKAAYADPDIAALLEHGRPGVTWRADFGFALGQCRTDWYNPEGCILPSTGLHTGPYFLELKSAQSLIEDDFGAFEKSFTKWGYHRQVALYREIIREVQVEAATHENNQMAAADIPYTRCFIIVTDKTEIPQSGAFELTTRAYDLSHRAVFKTLEKIQGCYDSGVWPGRPTGVQFLNLPDWEAKKLEAAK